MRYVEDTLDLIELCGRDWIPDVPLALVRELAQKCELIEMEASMLPRTGPHRDLADKMLKRSLLHRYPTIRPQRIMEQ